MAPSDEELDISFYRLKSDKIGVTDSYVAICEGLGFLYKKENGYWRLSSIGSYHPNELHLQAFSHWQEVSSLEVLVITGLGKDYIRMRHREVRNEHEHEHASKQHNRLD